MGESLATLGTIAINEHKNANGTNATKRWQESAYSLPEPPKHAVSEPHLKFHRYGMSDDDIMLAPLIPAETTEPTAETPVYNAVTVTPKASADGSAYACVPIRLELEGNVEKSAWVGWNYYNVKSGNKVYQFKWEEVNSGRHKDLRRSLDHHLAA